MKIAILLLMLAVIGTVQAQLTSVQLRYPLGGENIPAGENFTVHWQSDADSVSIKVVNIRTGISTIVAQSVAASTGEFTWEVPNNLSSGDMYLLKVGAINNGSFAWTKGFISVAGTSSEMRAAKTDANNNFKTEIGSSSANVVAVISTGQTASNSTYTTENTHATTETTVEEDDFYNPNMICEQTVCKIKTFRIGRLYPQPAANGTLSLDAESNENAANVTAELYSITGQKLSTLWEGNLKKGGSTFTMTLHDIASGTYILYLKNNKGEIVDYNRVVVAEGQR
jgi:hypothetical protein